ncbi:MAG: polysaccharide deacetylase family protein [Chitinophagaceae bacterium]|nr:polysaccharide deacetylase family protein [Chitinophagaceae bacterium]
MKNPVLIFMLTAACFQQCTYPVQKDLATIKKPVPASKKEAGKIEQPVAEAGVILARPQVPILCYHRLRDYRATDGSGAKTYIVPATVFRKQIKMLADSGYHTITAEQYYAYLASGISLPQKPVMISFDDTSEEQFTVGAAELDKYGFKGVFFIMTISIGRPGYMSSEQLKALSHKGHVIASHTTDHHNVKKYTGDDWDFQLAKPKNKLEAIIGKPVEYFAYPFGEWNEAAIPELKKRKYKAAFQLSSNKRDSIEPLYAIRRMIVPGTWDGVAMDKWMKVNF